MAFYDETGYGNTVGGDPGLKDIANLSQLQSLQYPQYGEQAAKYADPFMSQRGQYQKQLSDLLANPGSLTSSPAYQFMYNQGLNALQRKGNVNSGAKLAALQNYGQQAASQFYFPQAQLLSNLAMSGSNPGAAANSYIWGATGGMQNAQNAAAARAANSPVSSPSSTNQTPWWAQPITQQQPSSQVTGSLPYSNLSGLYGGMSGSVDYGTPGYTPSAYAGTGYMTSDYGTTNFGNPYANTDLSNVDWEY